MNNFSAVFLTLALASASAVAQQNPAETPKPADTKIAVPAQAAPAQTPSSQPQAQPAGPKVAKAKTKQEFADYTTATAPTDPAAMEKKADDFAAKYPDSELRVVLYSRTMALYQQANAADKTVEMGRKALALEPDEPVTLITVASVLAERTRDTDLDKDERLKDATEMSERGITNLSKMQAPAGVSPEQLKNAKDELRSMALGTLGVIAYVKKDYPSAEKQFKAAIDAYMAQPDPAQYLRLTLALDNEKKYAEALDWANKTLKISPAGSPFLELSNKEIERLKTLTGTAAKPAAATTSTPKK